MGYAYLLDRVVASVNGEPILESDLKMAEIYYGISDREELLKRLIEVNLLYQYMRARGVDIPDTRVDLVLRELARANGRDIEELARELEAHGLTLNDFKEFLKKHLIATSALREFLRRRVSVSELEIELEKMRRGDISLKREVELLVLPKEKGKELLSALGSPSVDLRQLADRLGGEYHKLVVERGELLEELDRQVWRAPVGELVFAEDEEHIYVARVLRNVASGEEDKQLRSELLAKKLEEEYRKLLSELVKNSVITIVEREAP
ncbi:MAG: peptidylprolyl isomerase [Aquificae bacterium]|nr:peptidylprolyl isomerase [Aquificota bacterium]